MASKLGRDQTGGMIGVELEPCSQTLHVRRWPPFLGGTIFQKGTMSPELLTFV
jgi:hypothetical protein